MKITRAEHLGMCFGVRDAIGLALKKASQEPLTILGELVHNENVIDSLRRKGIRIEPRVENVDTRTAMITAHGASDAAISRARERGLNVVQATCPLVHFAHRAIAQLVREGYHPVIVGIFNADGLNIYFNWGDYRYDVVGLASSRKFD